MPEGLLADVMPSFHKSSMRQPFALSLVVLQASIFNVLA